jgi:thiopurine S-methyltransferase
MDANFWLQRWKNNEIGFHQSEANPLLANYFKALSVEKGSRVFVPLCGKTLDIAWLLAHGYHVVGAELSELAIEQLFMQLGVEPTRSSVGKLMHYRATDIDLFVGDIFEVSGKILGPVDAIYDRAALVALPEPMRRRYTAHLMEITDKAPQLLISYEYDQDLIEGPPFSVSNEEVNRHYGDSYAVGLVASADVPGGMKGRCVAKESVWLLQRN